MRHPARSPTLLGRRVQILREEAGRLAIDPTVTVERDGEPLLELRRRWRTR